MSARRYSKYQKHGERTWNLHYDMYMGFDLTEQEKATVLAVPSRTREKWERVIDFEGRSQYQVTIANKKKRKLDKCDGTVHRTAIEEDEIKSLGELTTSHPAYFLAEYQQKLKDKFGSRISKTRLIG